MRKEHHKRQAVLMNTWNNWISISYKMAIHKWILTTETCLLIIRHTWTTNKISRNSSSICKVQIHMISKILGMQWNRWANKGITKWIYQVLVELKSTFTSTSTNQTSQTWITIHTMWVISEVTMHIEKPVYKLITNEEIQSHMAVVLTKREESSCNPWVMKTN